MCEVSFVCIRSLHRCAFWGLLWWPLLSVCVCSVCVCGYLETECLFTSVSTCTSTRSSEIRSSNGYLMFPVAGVCLWCLVLVAESSWVVCCRHSASWEEWVVSANLTAGHSAENVCNIIDLLIYVFPFKLMCLFHFIKYKYMSKWT